MKFKQFRDGDIQGKLSKVGDEGTHGDVCVVKIPKLPENFKSLKVVKNNCLALGEASGHGHQLQAAIENGDFKVEVREDTENSLMFFEVEGSDVALRHQEHLPAGLTKGYYAAAIVDEYDPFNEAIRRVVD